MRIISGIYKNRTLLADSSFMKKHKIRPSTNYTRQLVMNLILRNLQVSKICKLQDAVCADICCGSGAIGFEFLSGGAKLCYFVDNNKDVLGAITKTSEKFNCKENIITISSMTNFRKMEGKIDIAYIDPPYGEQDRIMNNFIDIAKKSSLFRENSLIISETDGKIDELLTRKECKTILTKEGLAGTYITIFQL